MDRQVPRDQNIALNARQAATQAGLLGLGFVPGAGVADYLGHFPSASGGTERSAAQNFRERNYGTAAMQLLGAGGDMLYAVPLLGATVGSALKAPRAAQRARQAVDNATPQANNLLDVSYRGTHTAPDAEVYGATLDRLDGIMPANVYGPEGKRLYGLLDRQVDNEWFSAAMRAKGNPNAEIEVYRAVPKGVKNINDGDWVTTSRRYAEMHGENALDGNYEIIKQTVPARSLHSEGAPYEFGYKAPQTSRTQGESMGSENLDRMTRDEFLGSPKIVSPRNSSDLKPRVLTTNENVPPEPFLNNRYQMKINEDGAAVLDGDRVIASYNFGDTLVVDPKYRKQGIGEELVYQFRTRYPQPARAKTRTKTSQAIQEKVWDRIEMDRWRQQQRGLLSD